jgi:hypothetical protein
VLLVVALGAACPHAANPTADTPATPVAAARRNRRRSTAIPPWNSFD